MKLVQLEKIHLMEDYQTILLESLKKLKRMTHKLFWSKLERFDCRKPVSS